MTDGRRTETRDKVAELIDQGLDVRTIALKLGTSTQVIYRHLEKLGIDPPTKQKVAS